jgi:hypothetical protein
MRSQVKHKLKNLLMKTFKSQQVERNHSVPAARPFKRRLACLAATALLAAVCAPTESMAAEVFAGAAPKGRLVLFSSDDPGDVAVVKVKGLQHGEEILGLDMRPATGQLYALGSSSRIYTIDYVAGTATAVGPGSFTPALSGTQFGFDFNPTVDRIRIVSDTGQNLRAHPDTGAIAAVDGDLNYATNDVAAGVMPTVVAAAYINNDTNPATGTVLFDIDTALDTLVMQNPPNSGTLVTVGALGLDVVYTGGFDVAASDGTAYAAFAVRRGPPAKPRRAGLYTIDLTTGQATFVGRIGGPTPLTSLATLGSLE